MFTKAIFPLTASYFLENSPAPVLGNINYRGVARVNDRPWVALSLVLCMHLAVFAALRPQPQSLPVETLPEPIMVNLLSTQQPPAQPMVKAQKPIKKHVKTPISKPAVPQQARQPVIPAAEQAAMPVAATSSSNAEQKQSVQNIVEKAADTQSYQSPSFNAAYLNNPTPNYPSISRRLGEEGLVLLLVLVTADGATDSVALQTGSGSTRLDEAALEAVKKWRFTPAKRGDQAISASVVVPVRFSLEG